MAEMKPVSTPESTILRDLVYVAFKRKLPLLGIAALGILIISYGFLSGKPEYEASARVYIKRLAQGYQMPAEPSAVLRSGEVVQTEIRIITSAAVCAAVVDSLGLATGESGRALAIARLERQIRTKTVPDADIIDVTYRDTDPERAAAVVNSALDAYLQVRKSVGLKREALHYLEMQAARARAGRDSVAARIAEYDGRTGSLSSGLRPQMHMGLEDRIRNDFLETDSSVRSKEKKLALVDDWLRSSPGADLSQVPSADLYEMGTIMETNIRLLNLRTDLADARARYTETHPDVQRLVREVAVMEQYLRKGVEQGVERQRMRLAEWKSEREAAQEILADLTSKDAEIARSELDIRMLEHDLAIWADFYALVADRMEEFRITAATDPTLLNVSIVSRATPPARPTPRPVNMKIVVGVFTIVFGILLVLALERADQSFGRRQDVQNLLGVKVLASIPDRGYQPGR